MTTNDAPVTVEQCDRRNAADLLARMWKAQHNNATYGWMQDEEAATLSGKRDDTWAVQAMASYRLAALASAPAGETFTGVEAWDELVNVDDRTSPKECPDMCLITRDELIDFMQRAVGQAIERHVRDALNDSEELADGSVNITADHARRLNADVDTWEAAAINRPHSAVAPAGDGVEVECDKRVVIVTDDFDRGWNAALSSIRDHFAGSTHGQGVEAMRAALERSVGEREA